MINAKKLGVVLDAMIHTSKKMVIIPHNGIDYDAIASALACSLIGRNNGIETYIIVNDTLINNGCSKIINEVMYDYNIINRDTYLKIKNENDMFVVVDTNANKMISISDLLNAKVIVIDHHIVDNDTINTSNLFVDTNSSSASEIMTKLLIKYHINIPPNIAGFLLSGIYLDTNKLTINVNAETFKLISILINCGGNLSKVMEYFAEDFESDRRVQNLVNKAKLIDSTLYKIALVLASDNNVYTKEELAKVADYLLKFKIDASFVAGNISESIISISARSKERIDVGGIMREFGGGGHKYSGAAKIVNSSIKEVGMKLERVIK